MHIAHHGGHVPTNLCARHGEQGIGAVTKGSGRAEGDERIHIRRTMEQTLEAVDEELLIDDHDGDGQQHLNQPHSDVIIVKKSRKTPAPHHMPHREVHQNDEKSQRRDEPTFEDRRFMIGKRVLLLGDVGGFLRRAL